MKRWSVILSAVVAVALALVIVLRPTRTIGPELPLPVQLPAEARARLQSKMAAHGAEMRELVLRVVTLDHDGTARVAGSIYDRATRGRLREDPALRTVLPQLMLAREAALEDQLREVVEAAAAKNTRQLAERFGVLTTGCVLCHDTYLTSPVQAAALAPR
jgi:hypothetical protein